MILLNPTYETLRPLLSEPERLMTRGTAIHRGRNMLCEVEVESVRLCIKRYGTPNVFRNFVYRYLRAPKGLRAWRNSHALRAAGFDSPEPVAYIQRNTGWGIKDSYYICLYEEGQTLYRWGDQSLASLQDEVRAFALFTARMHEAGFLICDYTPGNILCTGTGFTLVDTNRMRQGKVSLACGLRNMAGLWLQPETAAYLAQVYAEARGADPELAEAQMAQYRRAFWKRFVRRHGLHDIIIHRDLDGSQYSYPLNTTIR